jgi:hypothetical protein
MVATITNPEELKKIKGALQEISDSKTRIEGERDFIKDVITALYEEHKDKGITKKQLNKMATVYHRRNFKSEVTSAEEFEILYSNITGEKADE